MGTNNFTCTAKFVAKSAYTYVACNTYIQRVYIYLHVFIQHRHSCMYSLNIGTYPPLGGNPRNSKIHEMQFRNQKSGIGKHDSNFMNQNVAAVYGFMKFDSYSMTV